MPWYPTSEIQVEETLSLTHCFLISFYLLIETTQIRMHITFQKQSLTIKAVGNKQKLRKWNVNIDINKKRSKETINMRQFNK